MSIQIGNRPASVNGERIVIQSETSNLIHLYSTSSNSYMLFESVDGPMYNLGMSNAYWAIGHQGDTLCDFNADAIRFMKDTTFLGPTHISDNLAASNINTSNLNVANGSLSMQSDGALLLRGPVGIGTTRPQVDLHVIGTTYSPNIITTNINPIQQGYPVQLNGSLTIASNITINGRLDIKNMSLADISITGQARINNLQLYESGASNLDNLIEATIRNSNVFFLNKWGQVGIGTRTPTAAITAQLDDYTSSNIDKMISLSNLKQQSSFVVDMNGFVGIGTDRPHAIIHGQSLSSLSTDSIAIMQLTASNTFAIDRFANVGIATATPLHALHVYDGNNETYANNNRSLIGLETQRDSLLLTCTSNDVPTLEISAKGRMRIGDPAPPASGIDVSLVPTYSVHATNVGGFREIETGALFAPIATFYTINHFQDSNLTFINVNPYNRRYANALTSNLYITSNVSNIYIYTSNITNHGDLSQTIDSIVPSFITTSNLLSFDQIYNGVTSVSSNYFTFNTSNLTSNMSNIDTSNIHYHSESNIDCRQTNLSNIHTIQAVNFYSDTLHTKVFSTDYVYTNNVTIPGFVVEGQNFIASLNNFIFSGRSFCVGSNDHLQTDPLVQGKVLIMVDDAANTSGSISPAIMARAYNNTSIDIYSQYGTPYIQMSSGTKPENIAEISMDGDTCAFSLSKDPKLQYNSSGVSICNNALRVTSSNVGIKLGNQLPAYQLHVRGTTTAGTVAIETAQGFPVLFCNAGGTPSGGYGSNVGICTNTPEATLHVIGNAIFTGQIRAGGSMLTTSDKRVKTDLHSIRDAVSKVRALTGYTFRRLDNIDANKKENSNNTSEKRDAGLLAQDVLTVLPEVVHTDASGLMSVAYGNIAALFVEALKEIDDRLTAIEGRL